MASTQSPSLSPESQKSPPGPTQGIRVRRELLVAVLALLVGLFIVPVAVWMVGNRILGPYTHGANPNAGPGQLLDDFFAGLGHGSVIFWCVALGPYVLVQLARLVLLAVRAR